MLNLRIFQPSTVFYRDYIPNYLQFFSNMPNYLSLPLCYSTLQEILQHVYSTLHHRHEQQVNHFTKHNSIRYYQTLTKYFLEDSNYKSQPIGQILPQQEAITAELTKIDKQEQVKQKVDKRVNAPKVRRQKLSVESMGYEYRNVIPLKDIKEEVSDYDDFMDIRVLKNKRDNLFVKFDEQLPTIKNAEITLKPQKPTYTTNYDGTIINLKIKHSSYNASINKIKPNYSIKHLGKVLITHLSSRSKCDDDQSSSFDHHSNKHSKIYGQFSEFNSSLIGRRTPREKKQNVCFKTIIETAALNMKNNSRKKIQNKTFTPKLITDRNSDTAIFKLLKGRQKNSLEDIVCKQNRVKCSYLGSRGYDLTR